MSILTELPEAAYRGARPAPAATPEFRIATAHAAAWFAQLAYETGDAAKLGRILAQWGWRLVGCHAGRLDAMLPLLSSRGFIAVNGEAAMLVFCGTDPLNLADWIRDFSIHRTAAGIHAGFEAGVAAIWDSIAPALAAAAMPLFVAGHSLGGALAAVAARRLLAEGVVGLDRLRGVYTFGKPRAGDAAFASLYRGMGDGALAARTFRLVHGADIVPAVPPWAAPFAFRHVGAVLACDRGGRFDPSALSADAEEATAPVAPGLDFLRDLLPRRDLPRYPGHSVAAALVDTLPAPLRDHVMDRYIAALGGQRCG